MSAPATRRAPCPVCDRGPKDTAMSVTSDDRGTVSYCHRCGFTAWEGRERRPDMPPPAPRAAKSDWSARAESIWRRTAALRGTVGETYLLHRGGALPPADSDLRFLPAHGKYPPSLCARITDVVTARPISLHFTRIAPDGRGKAGTEQDKVLLGGHRKKGGVVRLWPDDAVTHGLGVAEGIESTLCAAHAYTPIWSCVDAGNLAALPVIAGIEALSIYADHDPAGLSAARAVGQRWADAGREVDIVIPTRDGADIADVVIA